MNNDIKVILDDGTIQFGNLQIGTTTTGEAGTEATVKNSGTAANAVLDFTIPRGKSGVYVGNEEPTDKDVSVWVDTNDESDAIPKKVSDLENDSKFITKDVTELTNYYDKDDINNLIGDIESLLRGV
jgi:hypothetical protein